MRDRFIASAWKAKRFALVSFLYLLFFLHDFSGIFANSEPKNISQTIEQLIQFSYFLLQKEVFLVYSFSEHVAAKGNSSETT